MTFEKRFPHLKVVADFERTAVPDRLDLAADDGGEDLLEVLDSEEGHAVGERGHLRPTLGWRRRAWPKQAEKLISALQTSLTSAGKDDK